MTLALVTGGAGFIGSHLVDALMADGFSVRVLDCLARPTHRGRPPWLRSDVEYLIGDVRNRKALQQSLRGVEVLFHLAVFGGFAPGISPYFDTNVLAYCRLLEVAAAGHEPLQRAVVASSQAVYGEGRAACPRHGPFKPHARRINDLQSGMWEIVCPDCGRAASSLPTSEEAIEPATPYALSKSCLEQVALSSGADLGIATTALRFGLTYGPRQSASNPYCGIVSLFSQRLIRRQPVLVFEDGRQTRDFIHVADVVRANLTVARHPQAVGRVFNVGTGLGTTILDVVSKLASRLEVDPKVHLPGWYRPGDVRHLRSDATQLSALGWKPAVSVDEGFAAFLDCFRQQRLGTDPLRWGLPRMKREGIVRVSQAAPATEMAWAAR